MPTDKPTAYSLSAAAADNAIPKASVPSGDGKEEEVPHNAGRVGNVDINTKDFWDTNELSAEFGGSVPQTQYPPTYRDFTKAEKTDLLDAKGIAGQALDNSKCLDAIKEGTESTAPGLAGGGDPRDVLRDVFNRGYKKGSTAFDSALGPPNNGFIAAAGFGEHPSGFIRFGSLFFSSNINKVLSFPSPVTITDVRFARVLVILHELKHLITGSSHKEIEKEITLPGGAKFTYKIPLPYYADPVWNQKIYEACLKNLKLK